MKKIFCMMLVIVLLLTLAACNGEIKYPNTVSYSTSAIRKQTEYHTLDILESVDVPIAVEFHCDKCGYSKTEWRYEDSIVFQCKCKQPYTLHIEVNKEQRE